MQIAHFSDLHINERAWYFSRHIEVLIEAVEEAAALGAELYVFAGDLAGRDAPHAITPAERNALADVFLAAASHAPVAILYGNHDGDADLDIFGRMSGKHRIAVLGEKSPWLHGDGFHVYGMPYIRRSKLGIGNEGSIAEQNDQASRIISEMVAGAIREVSGLKIVAAHYPVVGARAGYYEVATGQDITLSPEQIHGWGADYVALGHIHQMQQMSSRAFYCGSPVPLDFGETTERGYLMVEVERGRIPETRFVEIRSWHMKTIRVPYEQIGSVGKEDFSGCFVRLVVENVPATARAASIMEAEERLSRTAIGVKVQREPLVEQVVRMPEVAKIPSLREKLLAYMRERGMPEARSREIIRCFDEVGGGSVQEDTKVDSSAVGG